MGKEKCHLSIREIEVFSCLANHAIKHPNKEIDREGITYDSTSMQPHNFHQTNRRNYNRYSAPKLMSLLGSKGSLAICR